MQRRIHSQGPGSTARIGSEQGPVWGKCLKVRAQVDERNRFLLTREGSNNTDRGWVQQHWQCHIWHIPSDSMFTSQMEDCFRAVARMAARTPSSAPLSGGPFLVAPFWWSFWWPFWWPFSGGSQRTKFPVQPASCIPPQGASHFPRRCRGQDAEGVKV
eukprot:84882-Chlamydomonas_euryale.AAC.2